jgi:hypothetical protein
MEHRNTTQPKSYAVIYARGGKRDATWRRVWPDCTHEAALWQRDLATRMGYPAYVVTTAQLDQRGLPTGPAPGWDYAALTWTAPTDPWAADAGAAP